MKKKSYFLILLLAFSLLFLAGCAGKEERAVKKTVKAQLEQLKDFDTGVVQDVLSTGEILPEKLQDETLSQEYLFLILSEIFLSHQRCFCERKSGTCNRKN